MNRITPIIILLMGFSCFQLHAKETVSDSRTYEESFTVNADALVNVNAYESTVKISTWNENRVQVKIIMSVEAWDEEDMETMFRLMGADISGSATQVDISATACLQQVNANDSRIKVRSNGLSAKVKSYEILYEVRMPASNHLNIKNRYGTVELGQHKGRLNTELYECTLNASAINASEALITLKYSSGTLGPIESADLTLYESTLTLASGKSLKLNAKFSSVSIGNVTTLQLSAYEGTTSIGKAETLSVNCRYGTLNIGSATKLSMEGYEMALTIPNVSEIDFKDLKYCTVSCTKATSINITQAYESSFSIGSVKTMATNGKHCTYHVLNLVKSLTANDYESTLSVVQTGVKFESIVIEGKYMEVSINTHADSEYALEANLQYGSVSFPEGRFNTSKHYDADNRVELIAETKQNSGNSSITVKGYETSLSLR